MFKRKQFLGLVIALVAMLLIHTLDAQAQAAYDKCLALGNSANQCHQLTE